MNTRGSRIGSPPLLLGLLEVDHQQPDGYSDLDRGEADPGAAYMVSNMSATSFLRSSSNVSTGLEICRRIGSGVSKIGRIAISLI